MNSAAGGTGHAILDARPDCDALLQAQRAFHVTGRSPAGPLESIGRLALRPALMARYRDLARLRYDFPLLLVEPAAGEPFVLSLTGIVNRLVRDLAPAGPSGEALRKHLLRVEREIRRAVAAGTRGRLSELWANASARLAVGEDAGLQEVLLHAGRAIGVDGELADCDADVAARVFTHAWRVVQREKLARVREDINALIVRLNDILRADFVGSEAGRRPDALRASVGTRQQALFDFGAMAQMLARGAPARRLSAARRERIERTLATLRSQRFFPAAALAAGTEPWEFRFDSCRAVRQAFAERLPAMAGLVAAMSVAELEADGRYDESRHGAWFAGFDAGSLSPADLAIFPDYLVRLRGNATGAAPDDGLMELLSSGIPVKVLVETDDILEESAIGRGHYASGGRGVQLASLAMALNDVFVLQTASANLLPLRDRIRRGLSIPAPALFSVYTAGAAHADQLPRYLLSAAAMQSRAFPAFSYDPSAGPDLAARVSLENNPQPERDWPVTRFEYADAALQRISDELAFTLADFVAADARHAHHFARVPPPAAANDGMVPLAEWLGHGPGTDDGQVPVVLAVDGEDALQRLVVDDQVVQASRRCRESWHRLQELGGVHSSHAERLLARARADWEEQRRVEFEARPGTASPPAGQPHEATPASVPATAPEPEEEAERSPDQAWIETLRCSSCNECTQINDRMFAYDENQQAYIKDIAAGTFRELVDAAESCQLSIIHPGEPINPDEPGLEELLERARSFQ
jgi:hypothetical protein